jgi:hypothetical protein
MDRLMTNNFYEELHAKITAYLEVAKQAQIDWPSIIGVVEGDPPFVASDTLIEHLSINNPWHVILVCQADLERLEHHAPKRTAMEKWAPQFDGLIVDWLCIGHGFSLTSWPCPEIRAMAKVYEVDI